MMRGDVKLLDNYNVKINITWFKAYLVFVSKHKCSCWHCYWFWQMYNFSEGSNFCPVVELKRVTGFPPGICVTTTRHELKSITYNDLTYEIVLEWLTYNFVIVSISNDQSRWTDFFWEFRYLALRNAGCERDNFSQFSPAFIRVASSNDYFLGVGKVYKIYMKNLYLPITVAFGLAHRRWSICTFLIQRCSFSQIIWSHNKAL